MKLERGDYFGEIAFLYDCKRTISVKSCLYATLACIKADTMMEIFPNFPEFKRYLKRDCQIKYDDDIKLFLMKTLRKIDYLKDATPEILLSLAFSCNTEIREKGSVLFNSEKEYADQIKDEMIIVFDGNVMLYMNMDAGTEFEFVRLTAGSIINPHNILSQRKHVVNARMEIATTFFYLKLQKMLEVGKKHPWLA